MEEVKEGRVGDQLLATDGSYYQQAGAELCQPQQMLELVLFRSDFLQKNNTRWCITEIIVYDGLR